MCLAGGGGRSLLISVQRPRAAFGAFGALGEGYSSVLFAAGRHLGQDEFSELGCHEGQMRSRPSIFVNSHTAGRV